MCRIVRVPNFARKHFSADELSGWMEGICYTPSTREVQRSKRRERLQKRKEKQQQTRERTRITVVESGKDLL